MSNKNKISIKILDCFDNSTGPIFEARGQESKLFKGLGPS